MTRNDPYAALRIKEFNIFLLVRFALIFGWSMQFVVIEWQVYALTKDPLSLGIIGACEFFPAFFMAPFAGHIVDQREKRNLFIKTIAAFSLISFGLFWLTTSTIEASWSKRTILYSIYLLVFFGGLLRAFFGPTIFSLVALIVPKKLYPNAATWSSSTWQISRVLGVAFAGFSIGWIGVHWSLCIVFGLVMFALLVVFRIKKKPILNPKIGEPILQSLTEGVRFVFKTKAILGALTLDMISVLSSKTDFLKSNSEARRSLKENSISVNKSKVSEDYILNKKDLINDKYVIINKGKRNTFIIKFQ